MDNTRMLERELSQHFATIRVNADKAYFTDTADLHVGSLGFDEKSLEALIEVIRTTPNFYVFIGGDSVNHACRGSKSSQFEEYMTPREQIRGQYKNGKLIRKGLLQLFEPIKERVLGIIDGNHDGTRMKEFNSMSAAEIAADLMGIKYFGSLAFVELVVGKNSYTHFIHHSGSTGKKMNLNALQDRAMTWDADLHWGEHTHRSNYGRDKVISYDRYNKKPIVRDRLYVNASSFLSWSGYAKDKLYPPGRTGVSIVEMNGLKGQRDIRVFERLKDFTELAK